MASNFNIVKGERGASLLVFNQIVYKNTNNSKNPNISYWKCRTGCRVRLIVENNYIVSVGDQTNHTHGTQNEDIEVLMFMWKLRTIIYKDPSQLLEKLYRSELEKIVPDMRHVMPQYHSIRSTLNGYRRSVLPKLPKHRSEILLCGNLAQTKDGENFVLWDNDSSGDRIIILGTITSLEYICKCQQIFMDGTFQTIPKLFYQLYTIHGMINNRLFPLLFCLLPNKTQLTYESMLKGIQDVAMRRGLIFQPHLFQVDYEMAVINSIAKIFPLSKIKGCLFHYCQALWRKIQNVGLTNFFKDKTNKKWFRMFLSLPLVPLYDIDDAWLAIMGETPFLPQDDSNLQKITEFLDYFVATWLEEGFALFNRQMWNHFDTHYHRTTNALESWHACLKRSIQRKHPNLFLFLDVLKSEQMYSSIKIKLALSNQLIDTRSKKHVNKENSIMYLKFEYLHQIIGLTDYILKLAKYTHKKCIK